jgi:hypothetical protein
LCLEGYKRSLLILLFLCYFIDLYIFFMYDGIYEVGFALCKTNTSQAIYVFNCNPEIAFRLLGTETPKIRLGCSLRL